MEKKNNLMLYLELYLYKAKKIIISNLSMKCDLDEAELYLNACKQIADSKDSRIDIWFGKLELKRSKMCSKVLDYNNHIELAKNSFFMSLNSGYNQAAHYNLYKIYVAEGDYKSAEIHLKDYEKKGKKNHYNFSLIYKMLGMCLGSEEKVETKENDFVFSEKITYLPLLRNYQLAEQSFDEGNYNTCLKHLLVCKKLALLKKITIDLNPVIKMCYKIIEIKNVRVIDELKAKVLKAQHPGERIVEIRKLIALMPEEIDLYFLLIDSYISLGVYTCIPDILIEMTNQNPSELDMRRASYYDNLAREQLEYINKDIYDTLEIGDVSATNGDLQQAYQYYLIGLKNSGHSVFLSKLGDLFYMSGYYTQAESYYLEYLQTGYENKFKVYVNLYKMYRHLLNDKKAFKIAEESFEVLFLGKKGYTMLTWFEQLDIEYNQEFNNGETSNSKVKELISPIIKK